MKKPEDKVMQITYSLGVIIVIVICIILFIRLVFIVID
jgi:hypothetical protein|tara:strand:- start:2324 stop:2437 length:114 start_codon:yes stop_codon:yes gene_type:complete